MPGRFFDISANPSSATIPPGGTGRVTYKVANVVGRAVSAEFVIAAPDAAKAAWARVSNGAVRQFVLAGQQEFVVDISVPKDAPEDAPGKESQFGVFVKEQGDPEHVFDPGPPFTVTVKGEPVVAPPNGGKKRSWIIPAAVGAAVVAAAILFVVFRTPSLDPLPNVTGSPYDAARDTLGAHGYRDTVVATELRADKAKGTVLRQIPADSVVAKADTAFSRTKLVQLVIAAPAVQLPDLRTMAAARAVDTLQKLNLLIGEPTPRVTRVASENQTVLAQNPGPGLYAETTKVSLEIGLYVPDATPPPACTPVWKCLRVVRPEDIRRLNEKTRARIARP
jgi:hypothetical protein